MEIATLDHSPASILGLGGNKFMDVQCIEAAFAAGINYFFFYNLATESFVAGLKSLAKQKREKILIATGSEKRSKKELAEYLDLVRQRLNIDVIDLFFIEYASPTDNFDNLLKILDELHHWKAQGLIRYVGVTTHNRAIALKLIESGKLELLMHRYNMAHRKVEQYVLPAARKAGIPVIAFTATRWSSLLNGHDNWKEKIPAAADCYRYVLNNPAVRIALTSPKNLAELEENIAVLNNCHVNELDNYLWQSYGDLIYGDGQDSFETQWI